MEEEDVKNNNVILRFREMLKRLKTMGVGAIQK